MDRKTSVAIIGAGLGGLSAAIRLARRGIRVRVFERNTFPGGKAGTLETDGYRFDTGPSLVTMPFVLEELYREAGERLEDHLTLERMDVLCRYHYPDGIVIRAHADRAAFADEIALKTADSADSVHRYLDHCRRIYDLTADLFLFGNFRNPRELLNRRALSTLMQVGKIDPFRTMHRANATFFSDPKTIQLFDRYATYNGSNPYRTPATLNIIQHVEYNLGGYIVKEGIHAIPVSLARLAEKNGVSIEYNRPVEKIVVSNNRVTGLSTGGTFIPFEAVISNVDAGYTFQYLLDGRDLKDFKRYRRREPSSSALVFYWGMRKTYPGLDTHNIFFSGDYRDEFDSIFTKKECPSDPTIYVYISSRFKGDDAPPGCENWFVMINAPYDTGQNWGRERSRMRALILRTLSDRLGRDIEPAIGTERVLTPVTIEETTGSLHGSLYGISSNSRFAAFLRQPNRSSDIGGLYFCGGSTHPGGGIPLVLLSGKHVANAIVSNKYRPTI
jgi:phytoene desaturase